MENIEKTNKSKINNSYFFWAFFFVVSITLFFVVICTDFAYSGSEIISRTSYDVFLENKVQWPYISMLLVFSFFSTFFLVLLLFYSYKYRKNKINTSELRILNFFVTVPSYFWLGKTDYSPRYLILNHEKEKNNVNWKIKGRSSKEYFSLIFFSIEIGIITFLIVVLSMNYASWDKSAFNLIDSGETQNFFYSIRITDGIDNLIGAGPGDYIFSFSEQALLVSSSVLLVSLIYGSITMTISLFYFSGVTIISKNDIVELINDIYKM